MAKLYSDQDINEFSNGNSRPVSIQVRTDVPAKFYCDGEQYAQLDTNVPSVIHCTMGRHLFSFVSTEFPNVIKDIEKDYVEFGYGESIIISLSSEVEKVRKRAEIDAREKQDRNDKAKRRQAKEVERQRKKDVADLERARAKDVSDAKRANRAREEALIKSAKKKMAETTMFDLRSEEERRAYNNWKSKQIDWESVSVIFLLSLGALFLVSLVILILGWINGTGHAGIWTWTFWCSLAIGLILAWLIETDAFDN